MSELPLDAELDETMEMVFDIIKANPENTDTDDQLRMRIVASNLRALSTVLLMADENPNIGLDIKKVALGLLGTSDFIVKHLPEIEEPPLEF